MDPYAILFLGAWVATAGYAYWLYEDREVLIYVISGMMKDADATADESSDRVSDRRSK
jgi:hypothetical protein